MISIKISETSRLQQFDNTSDDERSRAKLDLINEI